MGIQCVAVKEVEAEPERVKESAKSGEIRYIRPDFDFRQTDETAMFVLECKRCENESVTIDHNDQTNTLTVSCTSLGSISVGIELLCSSVFLISGVGSFPYYYRLLLRFPPDQIYRFNPLHVTKDASVQNVLIKVTKPTTDDWQYFMAGLNNDSLKRYDFPTVG